MSAGPAIVAMTRRPPRMRWSTALRRPAPVVHVDVARGARPQRAADDDRRDARCGDPGGQGIVAVEADEQRAIDVPGRQVVGRALRFGRGVRHQQDELDVAGGERRR